MSKYINADKLIKDLRDNAAGHFNSVVNSIIITQPSADVVEVVRCKDCKWWGVYDEPIKHCRLGMLRIPVLGNEFCSKGERKTDET